ncbi:MAG: T9SS type A sorting domain-containing protein [bacterium]
MTGTRLTVLTTLLLLCCVASAGAVDSCGVVLGPGLGSGRTPFHQSYDLTLSADTLYYLTGLYYVDSTHTLTIPAGTVVKADTAATLIIKRGAKIYATGTASDPVVFTSMKQPGQRARGDWGGVIILGDAPVNQVEPLIEGGIIEGTYGGTDVHDNAGIFRYVRIEYCGYRYQLNNEVNGLTMGGVGDSTEIHHVQVSYSFDDSYEWFGGTVNCKYLVAFGGTDDEFDTDFGYKGKLQFLFGLRDMTQWDPTGESNGLETDNEGTSPYESQPWTHPIFANCTLVGPARTDSLWPLMPVGHKFQYSAVIRRSSQLCLYNSVIAGYPWGISLRDPHTKEWASWDTLQLRDVSVAACANPSGSTHIHDETRWPVADAITPGVLAWFNTALPVDYRNWFSTAVPVPRTINSLFTDMHNMNDPDPTPAAASELRNNARWLWANVQDPFFDQVDYRGAFAPDVAMSGQWTAGWTNFDPQNDQYFASVRDDGGSSGAVSLLGQNHPNPFSPSTAISFTVPRQARVALRVFNVRGQEVATLVDDNMAAGTYQRTFETGGLSAGTYFYTLTGPGFSETRKMVVLK